MNSSDTLRKILRKLNIEPRTFGVDYRDDRNNYFNDDVCISPITNCSDAEIVSAIIKNIELKGYTVYAVHEVLDGYSVEELENKYKNNPKRILKHTRLVYIDMTKERA